MLHVVTSHVNGRVGLVHEAKNCKLFPLNWAVCHCWLPFFTTSLTAAMMIASTVVDSELCGVTIVKVYLKSQFVHKIWKIATTRIFQYMVECLCVCAHIVACLCVRMSASLVVCPPHSASSIKSPLTSYSTLPGDGYFCIFEFVYETPFFLDPFSTNVSWHILYT